MRTQTAQYYISYERNDGGGYIASAPAIPGCVVYGKTLKEAYQNIQYAIKDCLEVLQEYRKSRSQETIRPETIRKFSFVRTREYVKT